MFRSFASSPRHIAGACHGGEDEAIGTMQSAGIQTTGGVGRIHRYGHGPQEGMWFWAMNAHGPETVGPPTGSESFIEQTTAVSAWFGWPHAAAAHIRRQFSEKTCPHIDIKRRRATKCSGHGSSESIRTQELRGKPVRVTAMPALPPQL
jgi:hypothetical protein